MTLDDILKPAVVLPPVSDRASLKATLLAYVNAYGEMSMPVLSMSRTYNKVATRYGTSVLDLLRELDSERALVLFKYLKTGAHFVLPRADAEALYEIVTEECGIETYRIQPLFEQRLQHLARIKADERK